ncbi:hypothetical protein [Mycolicibacterium vaccae]|uniref:hypothetical protein n=1 Tax=Mycolicibacterium vaccae TaxID=1810 RepID=UPI0007E2ED0D|nr:hypothetical protein [Mycolicibacterium vaccae]
MPKDQNGRSISVAAAMEQWGPVAFQALVSTARTYNGYITYKDLTVLVQEATHITYGALVQNWVGNILGYVLDRAVREGLPPLTSLCVSAEGTVGKGYAEVLRAYGRSIPDGVEHLDDHAAVDRLECYRYYGADLPPGGGEPTLTPKAKAAREWKRARAREAEPPKFCPECFLTLPMTGRCDGCEG